MLQLHILPSFDLGGLGSLATNLIRAWPENRRHVVFAPKYHTTKPRLHPELSALGIDPADLIQILRSPMDPMGYVVKAHQLLGRRLNGERIAGVLHYNFSDSVWNSQAVRRLGFSGRIISHVGTVLPREERTQAPARAPTTKGTLFVSASEAVRTALMALGPPPSRVGPVVWNGVDLDFWSPGPSRPDTGPITFAFTGRMAPEAKDFPLLIEGFKALQAPNARLLLIGDGPRKGGLMELARSDPRIEFLGELTPMQTRDALRLADVFVMAALPIEGMSMALVEAIALGLPIVATDVPANREVLGSFKEALLVPRVPIEMTRALARALSPVWRMHARIEAALSRSRFTISRTAARYFELCEDIGAEVPQ